MLMGNRTLRRASVAALIQAFENVPDEEKAERDAARMHQGHYDLNDFSDQVHLLEKTGPLTEEIPGLPGGPTKRSGDRRRGRVPPHRRDNVVDDQR